MCPLSLFSSLVLVVASKKHLLCSLQFPCVWCPSLLAVSSFPPSLPLFVKDSAFQPHLLRLLLPVVLSQSYILFTFGPSPFFSTCLGLNIFHFTLPLVCVLIYLSSINCFGGFFRVPKLDRHWKKNNLLLLPNFSLSLLSSSSCTFSISFVSFSLPILTSIFIISLSPPATINTFPISSCWLETVDYLFIEFLLHFIKVWLADATWFSLLTSKGLSQGIFYWLPNSLPISLSEKDLFDCLSQIGCVIKV